jgi:uncharacterized protein YeaO (DUF488 family)
MTKRTINKNKMKIVLKRIYETPANTDGVRILVDRLWPRGVSKERAELDWWLKGIGPTTELRKWFNHDPKKWIGFQKKYKMELAKNKEAVAEFKEIVKHHATVTLLYAAKDEEHNEAIVIKDFLT